MNHKTTLFKNLIFTTPFLLFSFSTQAQFLQTDDAGPNGIYTPQSLIPNVFMGSGVQVLNVTYDGLPTAVGYFSGGTQAIGLERGLLLTTGVAGDPATGYGPTDRASDFAHNMNGSTATDANLSAIATAGLRDVAVYTITFIPASDTLRFRYCFASEEYPEYSCTLYNDLFGFFIQGPGYPTPTNIAIIPGTNLPVAINNIHPPNTQNNAVQPCDTFNIQYYNTTPPNSQPVYDAYTDVFTAMAVVTPCETYTIKLAIADVQDPGWDSGVFLEARSFGTLGLSANVKGVGIDGSIAEGCTPGSITFSIANPLNQNYPLDVNIFGSATQGVDYPSLPSNMFIPAGQTQVTYSIPALEDNLVESIETIGFDLQVDACHRDTFFLYIRDKQMKPPVLKDTLLCTPGASITLNGTIPVPAQVAPSFSNTTDMLLTTGNATITSAINVAGIQPAFLAPNIVRSVCMNINHADAGDLDVYLISPGGQVVELTTDNGGSGNNYDNTCFTPIATQNINFPGPQAPSTAAPFTGNFLPEGDWSDLWIVPNSPTNGTWRLRVTDDFLFASGVLEDWSITFAPLYEVNYNWAPNSDLTCLTCPVNTVTPGAATTYSITASDNYGCSASDNATVAVSNAFATATVGNPISCPGANDGTVSVNVIAGGSNTYLWSDPGASTNPQLNNLGSGTYTVTVSNSGGCTATSSVTLTEPPGLDITANAQNIQCFGQTNGQVSAQVSGGLSPYTFIWSNGQSTPTISNLTAGSYTLTVVDDNGCSKTQNFNITQPSAIQLSASQVHNITCAGQSNGSISLSTGGGAGALGILWSNGQTGTLITGLNAGNYSVTVTDTQGCSSSLTQTITEPPVLNAFVTAVPVLCFGENNGELHLDVNGGMPGYNINWQGPGGFVGSGINLNSLAAGSYSATVTDQSGCSQTVLSNLAQPNEILVALPVISDTVCYQGNNGTATVQASGGTPPFAYQWDANGQTTATATGLTVQQYHVTVTDANGCTNSSETLVLQKDQLNVYAETALPKCHNGTDGTATVLSAYYGITPADPNNLSYSWNTTPLQVSRTASNLSANQIYTVIASDVDGCTAEYTVAIGNPEPMLAIITEQAPTNCFGESSGWATVSAGGGVGPYQWQWSGGLTPNDAKGTGLAPGLNQVTVTDANACSIVLSVTIEEAPPIHLAVSSLDVKCFGEATGSATVNANGGSEPYQYQWSNGTQNAQVEGLAAGNYDITVTDNKGCRNAVPVEISQPATELSGSATMQEPRCYGEKNGQIQVTANGGTPPYRYALDDKPFGGSSIQLGLSAGIYEPKVMDAHGCLLAISPVEVTQKAELMLDLGPDFTILLGQDTQLQAIVLNPSGDFQLNWAQSDSVWLSCLDCSNPSVYNLEYSQYFFATVRDSLGCRAEDQVLISVDKPRKVFVPTAFSPNGDLTNDLLLVHGQNTSKVLIFRVYDRWGELLYEAKDFAFNDPNTGWDGSFRGQAMDPGVYVWVLNVQYMDGATEWYKGDTTLIR